MSILSTKKNTRMKNLTFPLCLLSAFLLHVGCQKFIDDPAPTDSFPIGEVFQTADDLDAALTGVYDALQSGHLWGRNLMIFPDLMGGNAVYTGAGYFGLERVSNLQMTADDWYAENTWSEAYKAVNQLNAILAALDEVEKQDATLTPERAKRIAGEASFLRGVLYFELVRLYALPYGDASNQDLGVPLMLDPILKKEEFECPSRATVREVYDQINRDLENARDSLPEDVERGRAGKYAATAYLARAAFQQKDYANAAKWAGEILAANQFALTPTPQNFFRKEGSSEEIWVLVNTDIDHAGGLKEVFEDSQMKDDLKTDGYEAVVSSAQLAAIQAAGYQIVDLRCDPGVLSENLLIWPDTSSTNKYEDEDGGYDIPIVRLAEFLLMRAEALAETKGLNQESVDLLNQVRQRSLRVVDSLKNEAPNASDFISFKMEDFPDAKAFAEVVFQERRVELAFEGNYFHDLMRLKKNVQNLPYDDCHARLPIPQRERDANKNLVQNPCYD